MNSRLFPTVADSSSVRTCGGSKPKRQLPHDAPLGIVEAVELVHHHRADLGEIKRRRMQQTVEQDLRHDDQDPRVGIDPPIPGDQSDIVRAKPPPDRQLLHLVELLVGQRDQRRRVVGDRAVVQGLEQRRFRDERLARAGRCADQHPLLGGEPVSRASSWTGYGSNGNCSKYSAANSSRRDVSAFMYTPDWLAVVVSLISPGWSNSTHTAQSPVKIAKIPRPRSR